MLDFLSRKVNSGLLANALDSISANVMVADKDHIIAYVNGSLKTFLSGAEADIRKDLPHFSVGNLVGQSIDVFHRNPDSQRAMLAALTDTHEATIEIGGTPFDLVAQPIMDGGARVGTVVEWRDAAERIEGTEARRLVEAVGKSQAVIEFEPDGTIIWANANFEAAMGYKLDEIVGKHHRMFGEAELVNSPEYAEFWKRLGSGQFDTGEYKRLKKNGEVIWLRATYNPIKNDQGETVKVVKFAADITSDMERREKRGEAQREIDEDLGQISQAVSTTNQQAANVAAASSQCTDNVQTVAAGLEELVTSVSEISRQVTEAASISQHAASEAENSTRIVSGLSAAAGEIENVVKLISDIAEQTNLLALNATIEAARAGEAGKGFAVVASEVKDLASQTGKATEEIGQKIANVQGSTGDAVAAIQAISDTIVKINEITASISSSVEEQSATTNEMSSSMQVAADGVRAINDGITEIADATKLVDESTQKVQALSAGLA